MDNRFDNLETLRKAAWESITTRRKYEWQISIGFWGLLGSFIAALVTNRIEIAGAAALGLLIVPVLLCAAHCRWLLGLFRAYTIDKRDEEDLRKDMHSLVDFTSTTCDERSEVRKTQEKGALGNWNTQSQIVTTIALGILAAYIVVWMSFGEGPSKSLQPAPTAISLPATKEVPRQ